MELGGRVQSEFALAGYSTGILGAVETDSGLCVDEGWFSYDRARKRIVFRQFHVEGFVSLHVQVSHIAGAVLGTGQEVKDGPVVPDVDEWDVPIRRHIRFDPIVDRRTDLWVFGCVLYEMLTSRSAFGRVTPSDTIAAILQGEPDWSALPADTPSTIRTLLKRCLMFLSFPTHAQQS